MLSANNNNFSFPLWVSFVFFFCCYLIVQPRTEVAGAEILVLFLVFHEELQPLVLTTTVLAVGLLGFTVLKYIPSIHKCLRIFPWNDVKLCLMLLGGGGSKPTETMIQFLSFACLLSCIY